MDGHPIFLIVVDTVYAGIQHSKYWMPIHYDTIEDGQNKKSHLLFSKYTSPQQGSNPAWFSIDENYLRNCN